MKLYTRSCGCKHDCQPQYFARPVGVVTAFEDLTQEYQEVTDQFGEFGSYQLSDGQGVSMYLWMSITLTPTGSDEFMVEHDVVGWEFQIH